MTIIGSKLLIFGGHVTMSALDLMSESCMVPDVESATWGSVPRGARYSMDSKKKKKKGPGGEIGETRKPFPRTYHVLGTTGDPTLFVPLSLLSPPPVLMLCRSGGAGGRYYYNMD
jgi:hypothetical protein